MHFIISATFSISVTLVKYKKATKSLNGMDVKIARVILYWIFFLRKFLNLLIFVTLLSGVEINY